MNFGTVVVVKDSGDGTTSINEVEDLADQNEIKYGVVKGGETESFFKRALGDDYARMWQQMTNDQTSLVQTVNAGIQKVRDSDGKYAFIMESITAEYWVNKSPCNLRQIGKENVNPQSYGLALRKDSDLKESLDTALSDLETEGVIGELKDKWWKGDCSGASPAAAFSSFTPALWLALLLALKTLIL